MKNSGQKVLSAAALMIFFIVIGIMIGYQMKVEQLKQYPIHVKDKGTSEPIIRTMFHPGDTLTSKENGALILWDNTMIKELQVAYVTDSGIIEVLK
jgi:hypothetical protein